MIVYTIKLPNTQGIPLKTHIGIAIEHGVTFSPDGWMIQNNCKPFYSRDLSSKRNGDEFHTNDLSVLMKFIPINNYQTRILLLI